MKVVKTLADLRDAGLAPPKEEPKRKSRTIPDVVNWGDVFAVSDELDRILKNCAKIGGGIYRTIKPTCKECQYHPKCKDLEAYYNKLLDKMNKASDRFQTAIYEDERG